MIFEALGAAALGLGLSWLAVRRLPHRLPAGSVVLTTGGTAALFGAGLTHYALDSGNLAATLTGAVAVTSVVVSLLLRPAPGRSLSVPSGG
ncbi:hypothetical protein [Streptomyces sp. NPDC006879]|uniref:hypothetical protein n=1 Tax=Streptomyces sp. NPDC006879 TaxID=3364767 RepID=UPI0036AF843F